MVEAPVPLAPPVTPASEGKLDPLTTVVTVVVFLVTRTASAPVAPVPTVDPLEKEDPVGRGTPCVEEETCQTFRSEPLLGVPAGTPGNVPVDP